MGTIVQHSVTVRRLKLQQHCCENAVSCMPKASIMYLIACEAVAHCDIVIACTKAKRFGFVCVCAKRGPTVGAGLFLHTHGIASCFSSYCFYILWEVRHITSETTKIISYQKFGLARLALSL